MKTIKVDTKNIISILDVDDNNPWRSVEKFLGDFPEHVKPMKLPEPFCMAVDESGLLKELNLNVCGSFLYGATEHGYPIAGDIYILKDIFGNEGIETIGLTNEETIDVFNFLFLSFPFLKEENNEKV